MNRNDDYKALHDAASAYPPALSGTVARARIRYQKRRSPMRIFPVVACVGVLLLGTALAVGVRQAMPTLTDTLSGEDRSAYYLFGDSMTPRPLGAFSSALADDLKNGTVQRTFTSRDALEEYLGISLLTAPRLQSAPIVDTMENSIANGWSGDDAIVEYPDARYVLSALTLDGESATQAPEQLIISAHRVVKNSEVFFRVQILTEYAAPTAASRIPGMEFSPTAQIFSTPVPDGQGGYTWETENFRSAEQTFTTSVYTTNCGIEATIVTATDIAGFKSYIGHFIYDGALYTVYPEAKHDPQLDYPHHSRDMLTVLKHVLNQFVLPEK